MTVTRQPKPSGRTADTVPRIVTLAGPAQRARAGWSQWPAWRWYPRSRAAAAVGGSRSSVAGAPRPAAHPSTSTSTASAQRSISLQSWLAQMTCVW